VSTARGPLPFVSAEIPAEQIGLSTAPAPERSASLLTIAARHYH